MYNLDFPEISTLYQEAPRRAAASSRLGRSFRHSGPGLYRRFSVALGDQLIRLGQRLKEAPARLESEKAARSTLTHLL
jgi:hypothetical protein